MVPAVVLCYIRKHPTRRIKMQTAQQIMNEAVATEQRILALRDEAHDLNDQVIACSKAARSSGALLSQTLALRYAADNLRALRDAKTTEIASLRAKMGA
jgi:hypothetical protein